LKDYWDSITAEELRIAAKVARASGGLLMSGAAASWELRAKKINEREHWLFDADGQYLGGR